MKFDMNQVWPRAVQLMRSNFQLVSIIAAVFLLLPSLATALLFPDLTELATLSDDPEKLLAAINEVRTPLISTALFLLVAQFIGDGAMVALMGSKRPTVGEAIKTGISVVPGLLVILILFMLLFLTGAIVVTAPFSFIGSAIGSAALQSLAIVPALLLTIFLLGRMSLSLPVLALGGSLNPFSAVAQSFRMTGAGQFSIMLFWMMIVLVYIIISLLVSGVMGLVAALAGGGTAGTLILGLSNGVLGMAFGIVTCASGVAMYEQLRSAQSAARDSSDDGHDDG